MALCMHAGSTVHYPTHYESQGSNVPMKENEAYATVTVNDVKTLPNEAYGTLSECIKR